MDMELDIEESKGRNSQQIQQIFSGPLTRTQDQKLKEGVINALTIMHDTQTKKEINLESKTQKIEEIAIKPTKTNLTQIEQIGQQQMILSGEQENPTRLTIYDKGFITELNMKQGRVCHRTVFDYSWTVYMISGIYP